MEGRVAAQNLAEQARTANLVEKSEDGDLFGEISQELALGEQALITEAVIKRLQRQKSLFEAMLRGKAAGKTIVDAGAQAQEAETIALARQWMATSPEVSQALQEGASKYAQSGRKADFEEAVDQVEAAAKAAVERRLEELKGGSGRSKPPTEPRVSDRGAGDAGTPAQVAPADPKAPDMPKKSARPPEAPTKPTTGRQVIWKGKSRAFHDADEEGLYDLLNDTTRKELRELERKVASETDPVARRRLAAQLNAAQVDRQKRLDEFWSEHDSRQVQLDRVSRGEPDLDSEFRNRVREPGADYGDSLFDVQHQVGKKPEATYDILKSEGHLKSYEAYDGNVPKNSPPRILDSSDDAATGRRSGRGKDARDTQTSQLGKAAGKAGVDPQTTAGILQSTKAGSPERLAALKKRLSRRLAEIQGQAYLGAPRINAEDIQLVLHIGLEHYRQGIQKFSAWKNAMLKDAAPAVRAWLEPRLKAAHHWASRAAQETPLQADTLGAHLTRVPPSEMKAQKISRGAMRMWKFLFGNSQEAAVHARRMLESARGRGERLEGTELDLEEALNRSNRLGKKVMETVENGFFDEAGNQKAMGLLQMLREMKAENFDYDLWQKYRTALRENELAVRGGIPDDRLLANAEFIARYLDSDQAEAAAKWDIEWQKFACERFEPPHAPLG